MSLAPPQTLFGRPTTIDDLLDYLSPTPRGILNDVEIEYLCRYGNLITPYVGHQVRRDPFNDRPLISYGLSSTGYDIRLGFKFQSPINYPDNILHYIDPKSQNEHDYLAFESEQPLFLPPHGYVRGESMERFTMPRWLQGEALGKSTYARSAVVNLVTPLEPGWCGILTIEIANITNMPVVVYPGEGIVQVKFNVANPCKVSYGDRQGKYQNQTGVTAPLV